MSGEGYGTILSEAAKFDQKFRSGSSPWQAFGFIRLYIIKWSQHLVQLPQEQFGGLNLRVIPATRTNCFARI